MTARRRPPRPTRPPQITENEAYIWQALSNAVSAVMEARLALADAKQRIGVPPEDPAWSLAARLLRTAGQFADETLADRQRAARQPNHTDLMVTPESIDAFMEANPLPDEDPK